jgi:hypothetical protein
MPIEAALDPQMNGVLSALLTQEAFELTQSKFGSWALGT